MAKTATILTKRSKSKTVFHLQMVADLTTQRYKGLLHRATQRFTELFYRDAQSFITQRSEDAKDNEQRETTNGKLGCQPDSGGRDGILTYFRVRVGEWC